MDVHPLYFFIPFALALSNSVIIITKGQLSVGAIVDLNTRIGKEEKVAMEMAIQDFNGLSNNKYPLMLTLQVKNSRGEPVQAALAARHLIKKKKVQAVLGPRSWEETSTVAEVGTNHNIPVLSFADSFPPWSTTKWPFLIQFSPSIHKQMRATAAILQSYGWRRINVIYEDNNSFGNGISTYLYQALQFAGAEMSNLVSLYSNFADHDSLILLSQELTHLKTEQCRVFLVHTSLSLAVNVFEKANEMKMMEKGYVWITTNDIASLIHSMNASTIRSMQGVLGIQSYFSETGPKFKDFNLRFRVKFGSEHPHEKFRDPSIFAIQAYDATRALALVLASMEDQAKMNPSRLLDHILSTQYDGLSGKIEFIGRKLAPVRRFRIINVIGKSYQDLGFWSDGFGFSETIDEITGTKVTYSTSMQCLGHVIWPGGPLSSTPRGWKIPTVYDPLKIGVPNNTFMTNHFVKVDYDYSTGEYSFSGFSIEVFETTIKYLPYDLPYKFIPFQGNYNALVEQVYLKNFDAVVGDISIIADRYKYVEFSHSHTTPGLTMVVPIQSQTKKAWLFMMPFTKTMWLLSLSINVYNGFVIWMIERNYCSELKGSAMNQIGALLWLAFATIFSLHGEKLHSNLSKIATVVWLFVALIISQSYTASLASMLTVQKLEPKVADAETLKRSNALIGYSKKSFVANYLVDVLGFSRKNIRNFSTAEDCAEALKDGQIAAAFLETSVAKLFISKHCKTVIAAGPIYKVGGFGFAFQKGSPMIGDIDEALMNVFETGKLRELENSLWASETCVDDQESSNETTTRLSPSSFCVLFAFTAGTSTAALAIFYVIRSKSRISTSMLFMMVLMRYHRFHNNRFSRKNSDVESSQESEMTRV